MFYGNHSFDLKTTMNHPELESIMTEFRVPAAQRDAIEAAYRLGWRHMGVCAFGAAGMTLRSTNAFGGVAAAPPPGYVLDETGTVRKVTAMTIDGLSGGIGSIPDSQF